MADTFTTNLNLTKPEPGAAEDTWGISLNSDLDTLDAIFSSSGTQVNLNPNQVNFADNKKAIFGTGSDLEIYHDGSHSYIDEVGTGSLYIRANDFRLANADGSQNHIIANNNGAVSLRYSGSPKLATTLTGIDVTGTVTADGIDLAAGSTISSAGGLIVNIDNDNTSGTTFFEINADSPSKSIARFVENGDISFYDDTGTTQGLFWDASTERLGIGNTAPKSLLNVTGTGADGGILTLENDSTSLITDRKVGQIHFYSNDGSANGTGVKADIKAIAENSIGSEIGLAFGTSGTGSATAVEAMRISADGSVGIGTDSPIRPLHVYTSATIPASLESTSTVSVLKYENSGQTGSTYAGSQNDDFYFHVNDAERMRIDGSSGNVGIGTSNPSVLIEGQTSTANSAYLRLGSTLDTSSHVVDSDIGALEFYSGDGSGAGSGVKGSIRYKYGSTSGATTHMTFHTAGVSSGNDTERMRIDSSGNVGIGTTSPRGKLDITGSDSTNGTKIISEVTSTDVSANNNASFSLYEIGTEYGRLQRARDGLGTIKLSALSTQHLQLETLGTGTLRFATNNTEAMRIDQSGNVGIGTTNPSDLLHIADTSANTLVTMRAENSLGYAEFGTQSNYARILQNNTLLYAGSSSATYFYNGGTTAMALTSTGLGIGTTSPAEKLTVSGNQNITGKLAIGSASAHPSFDFYNQNTSYFNGAVTIDDNLAVTNGNVGIGTTSPTNSITTTGALEFTGNAFNGSGTGVWSPATNELGFVTSGSTQVRINSSGNVGIGTTNPESKLHVAGDIRLDNATYLRSETSTGGAVRMLGINSSNVAYIGAIDGGVLSTIFNASSTSNTAAFYTAGSERMRIDTSGNLLVGTTDDSIAGSSTETGINANAIGALVASRTSGASGFFNRLSTDGIIVDLRRDGSTVGQINVAGGDISIGTGDVGFQFWDGGNAIYAWNPSANLGRDAAVDLGYSGARFKDLYLSGGLRGDTTFKNNAGTTEYARFDSSANFLVGKTNSSSAVAGIKLEPAGAVVATRSGGEGLICNRLTSTGALVKFRYTNSEVGSISTDGSATAYNTSSDARLKDVTGEARGLEVITKLNPVAYNWKADGKADEGLIAQEVKEIVPNAVSGSEDEHYQMDYSKLVTPLVKAIQEQQEQIESLKSEIAKLKGE